MALTTLDATVSLDDTTAAPDAGPSEPPTREVRYQYSNGFTPILSGLRTSLLASTYQAGKLATAAVRDGGPASPSHTCGGAWAAAAPPARLAVGSPPRVWSLAAAPALAPRLDPPGRHDACFLTRSSRFTGEIQGHELAWAGDDLWAVN